MLEESYKQTQTKAQVKSNGMTSERTESNSMYKWASVAFQNLFAVEFYCFFR